MIWISLLVAVWYVIGLAGFIYWWTTESDLKISHLVFAVLFAAWLGPLAWFVGWLVHGNHSKAPIIVIKKR